MGAQRWAFMVTAAVFAAPTYKQCGLLGRHYCDAASLRQQWRRVADAQRGRQHHPTKHQDERPHPLSSQVGSYNNDATVFEKTLLLPCCDLIIADWLHFRSSSNAIRQH